jgi:hypothetical protein
MNRKWSLRVAIVGILVGWLGSSLAEAQTFTGSATGVQITLPATGTVIRAATGTLAIGGGGAHASMLVGDVPSSATGGVVSLAAGTLHSAIVGIMATGGGASMSGVSLTVSGNQITADFLMANSTASCSPAVFGSSQLQNLVINGQSVTVTGSPNQTIALPNGTVIINRQAQSIGLTTASLTVDALNVTTRDPVTQQQLANVVLGTVNAQIDCSGGSQPNETWTTGGGWILLPTTDKATFGVSGGIKSDSTLDGHLVYQDHGSNLRIKDTQITGVVPNACQTTISGNGQSDQGSVTFQVTVTDSPSAGDTFGIDAQGAVPFGSYSIPPTPLGGGNITVHNQTCS